MQLEKLRLKIIIQDPSLVNKVLNGVRTIPSETAKRWEAALELRPESLKSLVTKQGQSAWIFVDQPKVS